MVARRTYAIIIGVGITIAAAAAIVIAIAVMQTSPNNDATTAGTAVVTTTMQQKQEQKQVWTEGKPMPTPRTEVAGAALDGKIYIIGGLDRTGRAVSTVEVYDPAADKWYAAVPLPEPLHHAAAASDGDRLYVVGGYYADGTPSSKLLVYDPSGVSAAASEDDSSSGDGDDNDNSNSSEWQELASMPTARGALTANFVNGILYAIGGVASSFASPAGPVATNEAYDPQTNSWSQKEPMPTPRQHLTSAVSGGKLYVMGGRIDSLSSNLDSNEAYDPKQDGWTKLEPMPSKRGGLAAAAAASTAAIDGGHNDGNNTIRNSYSDIYVFGGESPSGTFENNERYSPLNNKWTVEPEMPTARHGLAAVSVGNKIYVIGGGPMPGLTVSGSNEIFFIDR